MMGGWYGAWPFVGWLGMVTMAIFWIAVVVLIVWAVARLFPVRPADEHESAVEILKRRYTRGEISQAEYEQARKALG